MANYRSPLLQARHDGVTAAQVVINSYYRLAYAVSPTELIPKDKDGKEQHVRKLSDKDIKELEHANELLQLKDILGVFWKALNDVADQLLKSERGSPQSKAALDELRLINWNLSMAYELARTAKKGAKDMSWLAQVVDTLVVATLHQDRTGIEMTKAYNKVWIAHLRKDSQKDNKWGKLMRLADAARMHSPFSLELDNSKKGWKRCSLAEAHKRLFVFVAGSTNPMRRALELNIRGLITDGKFKKLDMKQAEAEAKADREAGEQRKRERKQVADRGVVAGDSRMPTQPSENASLREKLAAKLAERQSS